MTDGVAALASTDRLERRRRRPLSAGDLLGVTDPWATDAIRVSPDATAARAALAAAVVSAVLLGFTDPALRRASRRLAAAAGDPAAALSCVAGLRQGLLRLVDDAEGRADRIVIDTVMDAALTAVVGELVDQLEGQALTDALTGLRNQRALANDLRVEVARSVRTGAPLTVGMVDVDGLKRISDRDGHAAGDDALRATARALRGLLRVSDRAYRRGGDEFAILLTDSIVIDADFIAARLRLHGAPPCSIGLASSVNDPHDELLDIADRRMYERRQQRDATERSATATLDASATAVSSSARHRVVLVDDAEDLRFLLRTHLSTYDDIDVVGEASNGSEGVTLVRELAPDLVVLDLEMPVMGGLEAIPLIRSVAPTPLIAVYTSVPHLSVDIAPEHAPDAVLDKGRPVSLVVQELHAMLGSPPAR